MRCIKSTSTLKQLGKLLRTLTNYVFSTYTYSRDISNADDSWSRTSKDFNRYVQRLRRLHNSNVQYLRSIEAHKDGYPHFHAVLRFPLPISVDNSKYFDQGLYAKWKSIWTSGLSDFQVPRSKRHPLLYIIKYVTKGSTLKTLWKKYYQIYGVSSVVDHQKPVATEPIKGIEVSTTDSYVNPVTLLCKKYKIKQLSWSRRFFDADLSTSAPSAGSQQTLLRN